MFENSFQNLERQKHYRNFWGNRLELRPSKFWSVTTMLYSAYIQPSFLGIKLGVCRMKCYLVTSVLKPSIG